MTRACVCVLSSWMKIYYYGLSRHGTDTIRITCPCALYPLAPHFHIVKLGFTGVYNCLIIALKHRLWVLFSLRRLRVPAIYVKQKLEKCFYLKISSFKPLKIFAYCIDMFAYCGGSIGRFWFGNQYCLTSR